MVFHRSRCKARLLQARGQLILAVGGLSPGERRGGGFANRSVARATTEVAGKLIVQVVAGLNILAVMAFHERTDHAGRAVTALGPVAPGHLRLDGMLAIPPANAFH